MEFNEEKTLVVIKPDGAKRGLVGEIISRFEKVGLKIAALKAVKIDEKVATKHYGYNEEWFEKVGKKVKEFYQKIGFDPGEELGKLSNSEMGRLIQKWNVDFLTEGVVVAMILKGFNAVEVVRKMVGATYPNEAQPGTIRGDYSLESPLVANLQKKAVRNLVHASGTAEEARLEIELWFKEGEIFE
ncbi:nucleoside-diphosphate kinase [Candidatus Wolfebacteria bacterium RIFCSPLOWO2_01_FULL_38_11]|uniref:nucleoside-diphosphate kinase n=2 Tax=Candidatus Wolfeibacteriota TaxID=1752735 RepID=A0A0G0FTI5_9BACT|nr:MAG: Nucleoside diphosphate kinase [Candidatus Wolfebacteria bacterium GW2011_GWC1_37_10]OGM90486.1 MAG: nucleoside-diphosphate kinase [Candidatus Wolfebacteria bacterium RIFCSPLOWO2_01_FULL_38_11]